MGDRLGVAGARVSQTGEARLFGGRLEGAAERARRASGRQQEPPALEAPCQATGPCGRREQRLQAEERVDVPLDVDLAGDVGPRQPEFVGLPEDAPHDVWRVEHDGRGAVVAATQLAAVPEPHAQRRLAADEMADQRGQRFGCAGHGRSIPSAGRAFERPGASPRARPRRQAIESFAVTPRPASRPTLLALSLGHGSADFCASALSALIPFLVVERHYSYAAVGVFALVASIAPAVMQPLAGAHGDRGEARWLLPAGLVLAGLGVGAVGMTNRFPLTLLAAFLCMVGVAVYHPEGARWARRVSGSRVTANMGVFSVGGGVGYALGPLLVAAVLAPMGLRGTVVLAIVPFAAAAAVAMAVRRFHLRQQDEKQRPPLAATGRCEWRTVRLPRRPVLRLERRGDRACSPSCPSFCRCVRHESRGEQPDVERPVGCGGRRHAAGRRGGPAAGPPHRPARAAARAGTGHRRASQPRLRRHDPCGRTSSASR